MEQVFGEFGPGLILVMVLGLVELVKKLGVAGDKLVWVSMLVGLVLGGLGEAVTFYPQVLPYVRVLVYGVLMGLAASGVYDLAQGLRKTAEG